MKKWNYSISTNTIWTSFDYGTVEADTYEEATNKAIAKLNADFNKANETLNKNPDTIGFNLSFEESQVQITEEINEKFLVLDEPIVLYADPVETQNIIQIKNDKVVVSYVEYGNNYKTEEIQISKLPTHIQQIILTKL